MTTPLSTYRLQLHAGFTFADAAAICPYLTELGVTHVYTSPILQAAAGSVHGYDTVDHDRISDDLGGAAGYAAFQAALRANGLGHVLDIVPNHMSTATPANRWWNDVLENGPSSPYAAAFDINWHPDDKTLQNRVLVAILGDHYGHELDAGRFRIVHHDGAFSVRYGDHQLPLDPRTYGLVLGKAVAETAVLGKAEIDTLLAEINASPDAIDEILEAQNYRLAHWRYALHELDYRRFFDVTSLAGLRIEDPGVFEAVHRIPLELVASGAVEGLRVDHPDGLLDPEAYFDELARRAPDAWIVAEKILVGDEQLRDWPVAGTTGYDFAAMVTGVLVNPEAAEDFASIRRRLEGLGDADDHGFAAVAQSAKREILREVLASEVTRLVGRVADVCDAHRQHRDHTRTEIRTVLESLLVELDVYRSYVRRSVPIGDDDRAIIDMAVARAKSRHPVSGGLVDFVAAMLRFEVPGDAAAEVAERFQQLSAPVMAKGVEDTATYRFVEMLALNDVGSDPGRFGTTVDELHAHNERMQARWPTTMTTLSTHDSKRSEDVRARLAALTWLPDKWPAALDALRTRVAATTPPEKSAEAQAEHFVLQTLAGSWPIHRDRMHAYVLKAMREAKAGTSWIDPHPDYEARLSRLVDSVYDDACSTAVLERLATDIDPIAHDLSVVQKALQLMSPGVPDVYQGAELLTDGLVDPDNRTAVDYGSRVAMLAAVKAGAATNGPCARRLTPSHRKLLITNALLDLRRRHAPSFGADATYARLSVGGPASARTVAFGRGHGQNISAVIVARLGPADATFETTTLVLPPGPWRNCFTGRIVGDVDAVAGSHGVAALLGADAVAVLERPGAHDNPLADAKPWTNP